MGRSRDEKERHGDAAKRRWGETKKKMRGLVQGEIMVDIR
jgi:hypothetical protein